MFLPISLKKKSSMFKIISENRCLEAPPWYNAWKVPWNLTFTFPLERHSVNLVSSKPAEPGKTVVWSLKNSYDWPWRSLCCSAQLQSLELSCEELHWIQPQVNWSGILSPNLRNADVQGCMFSRLSARCTWNTRDFFRPVQNNRGSQCSLRAVRIVVCGWH